MGPPPSCELLTIVSRCEKGFQHFVEPKFLRGKFMNSN